MKYVVWARGIEDNLYGGLIWQRKSPPMQQADAERYVEILQKKRGSKLLVFKVEREGHEPEQTGTTVSSGDAGTSKV